VEPRCNKLPGWSGIWIGQVPIEIEDRQVAVNQRLDPVTERMMWRRFVSDHSRRHENKLLLRSENGTQSRQVFAPIACSCQQKFHSRTLELLDLRICPRRPRRRNQSSEIPPQHSLGRFHKSSWRVEPVYMAGLCHGMIAADSTTDDLIEEPVQLRSRDC
jgi:hypothetical protein